MLPLQNLTQEQALSIVKVLINDTSEAIKTTLNTIFKNLIESNIHLEVVKILMQDERVDPSADDNWAIRYASGNGRLEIVKILTQDKRVDPSAESNLAKENNEKAIFEGLNTEINALKSQIEELNRKNETLTNTEIDSLKSQIEELKMKNETCTGTQVTEKSQTTEKKSKEDVLKEIINTMNEYDVHKISVDGSNITLKFVV